MPNDKKALNEELGQFESFITKQKQINESLKNNRIDIKNKDLWKDITGVKDDLKENWLKTYELDNLEISVTDKAKNGTKHLSLTIKEAKGTISNISNRDRLKAYAARIINCIKAKFLDGETYNNKGKQWDAILKDLKENIKKLNEIQGRLTENVEDLKPGFFGKLVGGITNWFASSPKEVRDIKCGDGETVYKKLESIIKQKNKLLGCGNKSKEAIKAQIKWRNKYQAMNDSQKIFWLNEGENNLLGDLDKLKFKENKEIENFLEELKKIAGYDDNLHDKVDVRNQESIRTVIETCLNLMSNDLAVVERKREKEEEERKKLEKYGTFESDAKKLTFTFNKDVAEINKEMVDKIVESLEKLEVGESVVVVGNGVKTIGQEAFSYHSYFDIVNFPNATTIGNNAFDNCSLLKEVNIPNATTIGEEAFSRCTKLTKAECNAKTTIGKSAFVSCSSLNEVNIPNATSIGEYAFARCEALTKANFSKAESIGQGAFRGCTSLEEVHFEAATTIGEEAFRSCSSLKEVNIPKATTIGGSAFYYCSSLTTVEFKATPEIGDN
ncbi:MAG: leucine-rich repeat domain-containing protein, partial [Acutalibacteraceae bacterium]